MQVKVDGKRNITLDFEAPKKFKLLQDGKEIPYLRTGKNSFRLSRNIDGVLDLEEIIEQPKIVKPMQLQAQQMALVNPNDVLMINQAAQQLEVEQNILGETQKRVEQTQAYLDVQQQRINETVLSVQELETDNAERITATENGLFNLAGNLATTEQNLIDSIGIVNNGLQEHKGAENPHGITKKTIGLDKVDNTSDMDKPISKAVQNALDEKADKDEIQAIREELGEYQEKNDRFTNALSNYTGGLAYSGSDITIDDMLSTESENPVQNKVITNALNEKADISDIPTVNNATLTIQKNGTSTGTFSANASEDVNINLIIPTTASDVSALPDSTKYGAGLSLTINSTNYVMTAQLKDQDGNNLGTAQTIDLPLESVVVNGAYDSVNKKIVLTLQNGTTIDIPVGDLISGLQTEITENNKLDADLVDDSASTNKFVTASDITTWNGKQDVLTAGTDLEIVRGSSGLPSGYAQLEYIESTGTQYIDTGVVGNLNTEYEITVKNNSSISSGVYAIFGSRTSASENVITTVCANVLHRIINDFGDTTTTRQMPTRTSEEMLHKYKITNGKSQRIITDLDTGWTDTVTTTYSSSLTTPTNLYIGYSGSITGISGIGNLQGNIYGCKIWNNGTLVRDFIPALDNNNTPCMYDLVNRQTYYNAGTGTFFVGSVVVGDTLKINFTNASGYTKNAGTVTSVNNTFPDGNGNVTLSIPTVNDATVTIQKNGSTVSTFTLNQSSNETVNIPVPTKTSDITNDSGYITGITSSDVTTALGYTPYNATNPNGYITSSALTGYATETWVGSQGYITGITSSDVTTALGYTPYNSSNPAGYTSNVGTVTSVNNISPDGSGNVSLTIPTVNNSTITLTQGGVTKGSFTLNQSTGATIALDAGGGGSSSYSADCPVLTAVSGVCTWTVTHTLATKDITIRVYEVSTGNTVVVNSSTTATDTVVISILSASDIAADTYRVVLTK